jgi:branched-chain amino acid transport system substrate-binding protein
MKQETNFNALNHTGHPAVSGGFTRMIRSLFACAASVAVLSVASGAAIAQQTPIKVGVVYSFSGGSATAGKEFNDTLATFQKLHGETAGGRKVEFVKRDDGGIAPDNAKRLAQELIVQEHVDFLTGLIFTPNAVAVGNVSTAAKMPTFIVNATTSGIMAKNPYMSRYSMSATQVTVPLAKYAYKSGQRNMYVLFMDYGPGIDSGKTFEDTFTAEGGKIAGEVRVPVTASDFSAYLQRIKDAKPDGLYVFLNASGTGTAFLKQVKAQGFDKAGIKLFVSGDLVTEQALPAIGDAAVGVISSMNYSGSHDSKLNRDFIKAFEVQSGGTPPTFGAVGAYDAFTAIYKVIDAQKGNVDPDKSMEIVKTLKFESPRGPIAIDPDTRDIVQNVWIRRTELKGGKLVNTEIDSYPMFKDPSEHP